MAIEIRRSIIFCLGEQGAHIARALEARLQHRHGGIPVVQMVVLREGESHPGPDTPFYLAVTLPEARARELQVDPTVRPWLPDIGDMTLNHRAGARLALLDLRAQIETQLLRVLEQKLTATDSKTLMDERDLKIASPGTVTIDIYLVGNLGEPLVSGMFIDLAYLIRDIMDKQTADNYFFQMNGVFLLPQLLPHSEDPQEAMIKLARANTYAAFKELDYYMDAHAYRMAYPDGYEVSFSSFISPFEPGYCYLVSATNEEIESINTDDAVNMVAEWFYHIIIAPIYTRLAANFHLSRYGAAGAIGAYSSLGLSALILPMPHIRDFCARRLARDLVGQYLLPELTSEDQKNQERIDRDLANSEVLRPDLDRRLRGESQANDRNYELPAGAYDALSPFEYQKLEKALISHYNRSLSAVFPDIQRRMEKNRVHLEAEAVKNLKAYIQEIFDDEPEIAVDYTEGTADRARNFAHHLLKEIEMQHQDLQNRIRQFEKDQADYHRRIQGARGQYFSAAQAFGNLPLAPAALTGLAILILLGYIYEIFAISLGYPTETGIFMGFISIVLITVVGSQIARIGSTRANYIEQYNSRLKTHRSLAEARIRSRWLRSIEQAVTDYQKQLEGFRDALKRLRDNVAEKQLTLSSWAELLYKYPYFGLEESVVEPEDVEAYYAEVFGFSESDRKRHVKKDKEGVLFSSEYHGPYHTWLQQWIDRKLDADAMWERLYRYSWRQTEVLEQHYLVEKIEERFDQHQMRSALEKVQKHAQPYLKTRIRVDLGEDSQSLLQQSVAVHFRREEEREVTQGTLVAKVLHDLRLTQAIDDFGEPYRLAFVTARRGLPLYVLPDVINYQIAYRSLPDRRVVHTTRGNIALPDIAGETTEYLRNTDVSTFALEPRQAFALAVAFPELGLGCFKALVYRDSDVTAKEESEPAGYYQTYVSARQQQIADSLQRDPKPSSAYLGASKAEACAMLYAQPELLAHLRQDIESYLASVPWAQLADKLSDYLERYKTFEGANDTKALEDWEANELDGVIEDILRLLKQSQDDEVETQS